MQTVNACNADEIKIIRIANLDASSNFALRNTKIYLKCLFTSNSTIPKNIPLSYWKKYCMKKATQDGMILSKSCSQCFIDLYDCKYPASFRRGKVSSADVEETRTKCTIIFKKCVGMSQSDVFNL